MASQSPEGRYQNNPKRMRLAHYTLPSTTPSTPIKIFTDATLDEHDTGISAAGWLFTDHNGKALVTHGSRLGKHYKSVQAELEAVKRALSAIAHHPTEHVKVYTDCHPVVDKLGDVDLAAGDFESVTLDWIPREKNQIADDIALVWAIKGEASIPDNTTTFGVYD